VQSAVAIFALSTLLLTLRTIISLDWLIGCSLWLVVAGILALLVGLGLALLDVHRTGRLLDQDVNRGQRRFPTDEMRTIAQTTNVQEKSILPKSGRLKGSQEKSTQKKEGRSSNAIQPLSYKDTSHTLNLPPIPLKSWTN
jgi:hypothetical protein